MVSPFPADPFGRCTCAASPPAPATAARLCASVSLVEHTRSQSVHITAALWGGNFARTVPLSLRQAHELGVELVQLVHHALGDVREATDEQAAGVVGGPLADVDLHERRAVRGRLLPAAGAGRTVRDLGDRAGYPRVRPTLPVDSRR